MAKESTPRVKKSASIKISKFCRFIFFIAFQEKIKNLGKYTHIYIFFNFEEKKLNDISVRNIYKENVKILFS